MTLTRAAALSALLFCYAGPAWAQNVRLEFHDGKVNLIAQNASLRAILTEWARLGGTQVVNMERLAGPPVTLQLTDVPEMQALDTILASARPKDALTLWHLLSRGSLAERGRVYDRLTALVPAPPVATRDAVLRGDRRALDEWWNKLGLDSVSWWRFWKRSWR